MRAFELTEGRSQPIDEQAAMGWLRKNSNQFVHQQTSLYRGVDSRAPYLLLDPSGIDRKALGIQNYVNLMVSNFPEWQTIPKRSQSVICSTSSFQASSYGYVYRVYPIDSAKFAALPKEISDFWALFLHHGANGVESVPQLNKFISNLGEDTLLRKVNDTSFDAMITDLERIQELRKQKGPFNGGHPLVPYFNKYGLVKGFQKFMDPTFRGVRVVGVKELGSLIGAKNDLGATEVWTESPCLLVQKDLADTVEGNILTHESN